MSVNNIVSLVFANINETVGWLTSKPAERTDIAKKIAVLATLIIGSAAVFAGLAFSGGLPLIAIAVIAVASSVIASLVLACYLRSGPDSSDKNSDKNPVRCEKNWIFQKKNDMNDPTDLYVGDDTNVYVGDDTNVYVGDDTCNRDVGGFFRKS
jgi:hypothetical protein